ncbi:MAG: hypothetical protein IKH16_07860, partial [Selenomonadaceae bacterium]|nr:hypothetical protein [Selenomonadaceae bacterium]
MAKRIWAGSVFGLDRKNLYHPMKNPHIKIYLDAPVQREKLERALRDAVSLCPYLRHRILAGEGNFLELAEHNAPLHLHQGMPEQLDVPENNGYAFAVYYEDRVIGIVMNHVLSDGIGYNCFVRSLLDIYFGEPATHVLDPGAADYDFDPLAKEWELSMDTVREPSVCGSFVRNSDTDTSSTEDMFAIKISRAEFRSLCCKFNASVQTMLTFLAMQALRRRYPKGEAFSLRIPLNARKLLGVPGTFHNTSLANIRVQATNAQIGARDGLVALIREQIAAQNTRDFAVRELNLYRKLLLAESDAEFYKLIDLLLGNDVMVVSYLGSSIAGDSYASHILDIHTRPCLFPLTLYAFSVGDRLCISGYDANGHGAYRRSLQEAL